MNENPTDQDYSKPVAYDQQGHPLYARPPEPSPNKPSVVYVARPVSPAEQPIPPEIMQRYEESHKKYPALNLSKGEYVISSVKRHPIGLVQIWVVAGLLLVGFGTLFGLLFFGNSTGNVGSFGAGQEFRAVTILAFVALFTLVMVGSFIATYIYNSNRFYLTNESVIQEIQIGIFNRHEQTVSLANVEDASYKQTGILSYIFNFGTIRLSTMGDETTYVFTYVMNPKKQIAELNDAVESFKNGRAVE